MASSPLFSGVLFGAAYYAEYQPSLDLEHDFDLMKAAGFTVIRVGESVWSTWEPREGEFDLDWLEPVLQAASARGIGVILGTPTYAAPPWLQRRHPEIAAEHRTGARLPWGGRQEMDQSAPAYRFFAERVTRRILERYAEHPAIIGFQVDNEPGFRLPHNEHTFQRFVDWLAARYGTVENLNERWGLVYWSHRLSTWADLWRPDGNTTPQYDIEWRRFQGSLAEELIGWQADLVREYARDDQFVTTCLSYTRSQVDDERIVRPLDVVAGNPYYRMQDGLDLDHEVPTEELWWSTGVWALFQWGDRAFSSADAPYLVTETNAQSVGNSSDNFPPYPGQLRQAAFALLARGGRMVEYWHWHTLHFGAETYWGGVLPHSQKPGRIYREVAALGASLQRIGSALDHYVPDSDILMLYSTDTKWAFEFDPPLRLAQGGPDRGSYARIFDAFYRGMFESGAQIRVQHAERFEAIPAASAAAAHPVVVVPALHVASDDMLEALRAYAHAGGHLVVGVRTGYGDDIARARRADPPAMLAAPAGVTYGESSTLLSPLAVRGSATLPVSETSAAVDWIDVLEVSDAEVIATYAANPLLADAAITTRAHGSGRITYIGCVPNASLANDIGRWLAPERASAAWSADRTVTVSSGTSSRSSLSFVANWSGAPAEITPPIDVRDVETHVVHPAGVPLLLEPRGAVLLEALRGH
ncbi:beta-galactosidase [Microbacterium sp. NPDC089318]